MGESRSFGDPGFVKALLVNIPVQEGRPSPLCLAGAGDGLYLFDR
jgi:hypothetical protein